MSTENDYQHQIALSVRNLSKCYQIYDRPHNRLLQSLWRGRRQYYREFWALHDVSLEIPRGETFGIIGRNGSGKSTLLQLIAGTLTPSSGEVKVNGRVAALLELGSGFNPDFTGRENVLLNGRILGLTEQEMRERFDTIAAFADIGDFIEQPLRTYSSGMMMRLAFAVSVNVDPEILIIDEALSVGDLAFQFKCMERLRRLTESGTTLLFVSHDLGAVKAFCRRAAYLRNGELRAIGTASEIAELYMLDIKDEQQRGLGHGGGVTLRPALGGDQAIAFGTGEGRIVKAFFSDSGSAQAVCTSGDIIRVTVEVEYLPTLRGPSASIIICDHRMIEVSGRYLSLAGQESDCGNRRASVTFAFAAQLNNGNYFLTVRLEDRISDSELMPVDKQVGALSLSVTRSSRTHFIGITNMPIRALESVPEMETDCASPRFAAQHERSILFITLDSCRYDSFLAAQAPHLKAVGPLHRAMAPASFTYGSHAAMFVGFTPGIAEKAESLVNPKYGKIFKMVGNGFAGKGTEFIQLGGRNIVDGLRRQGYLAIGCGAVGWFNPDTETGEHLSRDFDHFWYSGNTYSLSAQLHWLDGKLDAARPCFAFLNIGETHVPYYYAGAPWDKNHNPCIPFGTANDRGECQRRQIACVEYVDKEIATLLQAFAGASIIICADHGDCWGEDGLWEHGIHHPKALEVPLLFRLRKA